LRFTFSAWNSDVMKCYFRQNNNIAKIAWFFATIRLHSYIVNNKPTKRKASKYA
jgi:hypothetical protein